MTWLVMQTNPGCSTTGGILVHDRDEGAALAAERRVALALRHGAPVEVRVVPVREAPSLQPVKPTDNPPSPHERDA